MSRYVVDAYAWIEYLEGSAKGSIVDSIVRKEKNEAITASVTVAEVVSKAARSNYDVKQALEVLRRLSLLHEVEETTAELAGRLHTEVKKNIRDFGLADAFVLATARMLKAKIVTGDPHFKGMRNVILL